MQDQLLRLHGLRAGRGITIRVDAVELTYGLKVGKCIFHIISRYVDFTYKCHVHWQPNEECILVVDALQGIESASPWLTSIWL